MSDGLVIVLAADPDLTERGLTTRGEALNKPLVFQCPPLETFSTNFGFSHSDYDTVYGGQISRKGGRQLRTITFDTLLVDWGSYIVSEIPAHGGGHASAMHHMSRRLIDICESGSPFEFDAFHAAGLVDDLEVDVSSMREISFTATLRSLRVEERHGEGDTRYLNVSFTEYVDPVVRARKLGSHTPRDRGSSALDYGVGRNQSNFRV